MIYIKITNGKDATQIISATSADISKTPNGKHIISTKESFGAVRFDAEASIDWEDAHTGESGTNFIGKRGSIEILSPSGATIDAFSA